MTLQTAIFLWLMNQTPHKDDAESYDEREDRMYMVSRVVAETAGGNFTLAAAELAIAKHESHFSEGVHSGKVTGDSGKSVCFTMVHKNGLRDDERHATLTGTDEAATARCFEAGLEIWGRFWGCYRKAKPGERWDSMFSAYGTGAGCAIEATGRAKAATFRSTLNFLYLKAGKT